MAWQCSRDAMKEAIVIMEEIDVDDLKSPANLLTAAMIIAIVYVSCIGFPTFFIMCIVIKCRTHCCLRVLFYITLSIEFVLSLTCMIMSSFSLGAYNRRRNTLK